MSTNSTPYGVMNSRGPPDALHRVCGSSRSKFAWRAACSARAQGWNGTASSVMLSGRWLVGFARLTLFGFIDSCTMPGGVQMPFSPGGGPRFTRPSGQRGVGFEGGGGPPPRRCAAGAGVPNAAAALGWLTGVPNAAAALGRPAIESAAETDSASLAAV